MADTLRLTSTADTPGSPRCEDAGATSGKKYVLTTLGCKVNQYESQQIRETLESLGLCPARARETPDVAVVNTCAVTSSAAAKSRQAIRRITRNGLTSVVVVGCGAAADTERILKIDGVSTVLDHSVDVCGKLRTLLCPCKNPPGSPNNIVSRLLPAVKGDGLRIADCGLRIESAAGVQSTIDNRQSTIGALTGRIGRFAGHQRAFLKVQEGCDASCTYCIVPRLRSDLRSKPIDATTAEARDLVRSGHKEIVVTGIFLGAYGRDTAIRKRFAAGHSPLAELVDALARVEGLERVRLSSLEPGDLDERLLDVLAFHKNCVPHLHLPLQSGSARILKRMNRQYTLDAFVAMVNRVRHALDRPAITTDIIVGFPGETEEDFQATLKLARHTRFAKIHAFPFSPREGTPAARWQDQFVHPSEVRERMNRLLEVERESSLAYRRSFVGEIERILVEIADCRLPIVDCPTGPKSTIDNLQSTIARGRSDRYFEVHFEASEDVCPGDLVSVRIDRVTPTRTHGTHT